MRRDDNSLGIFIFGAILGALGLYLTKEDNRDKVADKFDEIKGKGNKKLSELKTKIDKTTGKVQDEMEDIKDQMVES